MSCAEKTIAERTLDALKALGPVSRIVAMPATGLKHASSNGSFRALWVGGAGDVVLVTSEGQRVTLPNVAAGMWHGIAFREIVASGTQATDVFAGE